MANLESYNVQLGAKVNAISLVLSSICATLPNNQKENILKKIEETTELTKELSIKDNQQNNNEIFELLEMTKQIAFSIVQR